MTPSIACWINVFDLVGDDLTVVAEFEVAWVYKDSNKLIKISRFILKSTEFKKVSNVKHIHSKHVQQV